MISSSDGTGAGQITKSNRPNAVFYPGEMKGQNAKPATKEAAKEAVKDLAKDIGAWQARSVP
jgi:hypothetical protein